MRIPMLAQQIEDVRRQWYITIFGSFPCHTCSSIRAPSIWMSVLEGLPLEAERERLREKTVTGGAAAAVCACSIPNASLTS